MGWGSGGGHGEGGYSLLDADLTFIAVDGSWWPEGGATVAVRPHLVLALAFPDHMAGEAGGTRGDEQGVRLGLNVAAAPGTLSLKASPLPASLSLK